MPITAHPKLCLWITMLCVAALPLAGCDALSSVRVLPSFEGADQQEKEALAELPYPGQIDPADSLDIVVRRDRGSVVVVNRTPAVYTGVYIWLNQQYVARLDELTLGDNGEIDLQNFVNQHAETFPVATLLAPDAGDRIVLAELFVPGSAQRYRLLVRDDT